MNQWWQLWTKWLSEDDCNRIIESCKKLPPVEGHIGHGGKANLDSSWRRSTIRWVPKLNPDFDVLFKSIKFLFEEANSNAFGFHLSEFREVQFTEYHETVKGNYAWHKDLAWTKPTPNHRKLSMVAQLSKPTDYEGGKLELDVTECQEVPGPEMYEQGSIIVFPSFLSHQVTPVTKGTRYSLVSWHEGPKFR